MKNLTVGVCVLVFVALALGQGYKPSAGYVPDSTTAIKIAEAVLVPVYGRKQIDSELPLHAQLKDDEWTVTGTLHCPDGKGGVTSMCFGGVAVVQISILSMTHYK